MILSGQQIKLIAQINNFLRNKKPVSCNSLIHKLKKINSFNQSNFFSLINLMIDNELIKKLKNGKLLLMYEWTPSDLSRSQRGKISLLFSGSAFVVPAQQTDAETEIKYFIHKSNLHGAIDGDIVEFAPLIKSYADDKFSEEAMVLSVKSHTKTRFVGTFLAEQENGNYHVMLDGFKTNLKIILDDTHSLMHNDKIYFEIYAFFNTCVKARLIKKIGNSDDLAVAIESILLTNSVPINFSQLVQKETNEITEDKFITSSRYFRDITSLPFITVDPETAKDFDDAVYVVKENDNTYRLVVAIAAVATYVKAATEIDASAFQRSFSIYLHDRVIPMLPHRLSDDLCSLNEAGTKHVYVADMQINQDGDLIDYKVYPALMKNYRRCTYNEINELINNNFHSQKLDPVICRMIESALKLSEIIAAKKSKKGLIAFDFPEVEFSADESQQINFTFKNRGLAEKMIENFMISANEVTALFAIKHKLPFIYRVHSGPNKDLISDFLKNVKKIGVDTRNIDFTNATPKQLFDWLDFYRDKDIFNLLSKLVLRILGKAKYSTENTHHFALASSNYTHFTSPIRRYADLIVHRIFELYIFSVDHYTDTDRRVLASSLPSICKQISEMEIKTVEIERQVISLLFCRYMENHIGEKYNGVIVGVQSFGLYVELENTVEGFVHITQIDEDDFFVYNEEDLCIIGEKKGKKYNFGNKIKVLVLGVDRRTLRINLKIVPDTI